MNVFATTQIIKQDKKYINNTTTIFSPNLIEQDKTVATLAKLYEEMIFKILPFTCSGIFLEKRGEELISKTVNKIVKKEDYISKCIK